ncbi:MAG: UbiA family prenyltransferase [Planctomycetota bacterium]
MFNKLKRFIDSIETLQISLGWWLVAFFSIIAIRNFLEGALEKVKTIGCETDPFMAIVVFFGHYPLLYVSQFLILAVIVRLLTRERIEKISKTLIVFWIIWFPPIFDFIWSAGRGENLTYAHTLEELWTFFVNCANPTMGFPDMVSPGIRVEFIIASLLAITYVFVKTRSIIKSLLGAVLFYASLIFYVFGFPALIALAWHGLFPNLPPVYEGTLPYEQVYYSRSLISNAAQPITLLYLMVTILGLLAWYFLYDRSRCLALIKNIRLTRSIHYCGLTLGGILLAYQAEGVNFPGVFSNPIDYLAGVSLCLSVFFAFQAMIVANDIVDVEADRISNPNRPLAQGAIPVGEYKTIGWIYFLLSIGLAFNVSITAMFITLFFNALYLVYSAPPLRIKRFFPLNMMVIGINSTVAMLLGYSLFGGVKTVDKFPTEFMLLIPLGFFLAANIITIKDIESDRRTGVLTLPALLGEKWGKAVIALLALGSFLCVPWLLEIPKLWPLAVAFGILAGLLVLMRKWYETLFFVTYFIYALAAVYYYVNR